VAAGVFGGLARHQGLGLGRQHSLCTLSLQNSIK
jgi:hypothetical protein